MFDIAMCRDKMCPLKDTCYRYTAIPDEYRQSYFINLVYNDKEAKCDYYWPTEVNIGKTKRTKN